MVEVNMVGPEPCESSFVGLSKSVLTFEVTSSNTDTREGGIGADRDAGRKESTAVDEDGDGAERGCSWGEIINTVERFLIQRMAGQSVDS
jgi:hypothetical protein